MTTVASRIIVITILIGVLLAGCGAGTNNPAPAVRPYSAAAAKAPSAEPTVRPANGVPLLGDLDEDGSAGVGDAIKILRIVVNLDDDTPVADANQNCSTDVGDAIKILRLVVGLDTDWPLTWQKTWVTGDVKEYIDEENTPPLEGVEVTVGGQSDTSDSNGEFEIHCVPLGDQALAVIKTGYVPAGSLPTTVSVQAPSTELSTIYMIDEGSVPPPGP